MKKYLLPLLVLLIASKSFAQYTVSGRVINKTDKKTIPNAVVFINNSAIESTTDSTGQFRLNLPAGHYNLVVTIVGYESYKTPLTVKGKTVLNDIKLVPEINVSRLLRRNFSAIRYLPVNVKYLTRWHYSFSISHRKAVSVQDQPILYI
jgi:hypothetical protein